MALMKSSSGRVLCTPQPRVKRPKGFGPSLLLIRPVGSPTSGLSSNKGPGRLGVGRWATPPPTTSSLQSG
eukprot:6906419-Prymnesium_polylepis.1